MIYTLKSLESSFGKDWVSNGALVLEEYAFSPNVQRGGELLTAVIHAGRQRVRVYVKVRQGRGGRTLVEGECSCPAKRNCRHVAAVLLKALLDEQELSDAGPRVLKGLGRLERGTGPQQDYPPQVRQRLVYLLATDPSDATVLYARTRCARTLPSGAYVEDRRYEPAWALRGTPPRFLLQADLEILEELHRIGGTQPALRGELGERLLRAMMATGRCHLVDSGGPALGLAAVETVAPDWALDPRGGQCLSWDRQPVVLLATLWHLDAVRAQCVPLTTGLPSALLAELLSMGTVAPEQVPQVKADLGRRYPELGLPELKAIAIEDYPAAQPRAQLQLRHRAGPVACISFAYGEIEVGTHSGTEVFQDGTLFRLSRDEKAEQRALLQLTGCGLSVQRVSGSAAALDCLVMGDDALAWLDLQHRLFPELRSHGWRCTVDANFPYRLARPERWFGACETLQRDRFGVTLGVQLAGQAVNLLPELMRWLRKQPLDRFAVDAIDARGVPLPLPDGRYLLMSKGHLRRVLDTVFELRDAHLDADQRLRLGRYQLLRLTELDTPSTDEEPVQWLGAEELQALADRLRRIESIPRVEVPKGLHTVLRPYQQQGLDWLQFLRAHGLSGILADDMGLGKTVQALAHLLYEKEHGHLTKPSLVVAPTSLMDNWRRAVQRFAPQLRFIVLHGTRRHALFEDIAHQDLVITTYPLLLRDREHLLAQGYHLLILDEAQVIKNARAKASRIIREFDADYRLCLTGTPLENHLGELWSLFDFLLPGLLGSEHQFRMYCRRPIENGGDESMAERLRRRIRPFLLRRTKQSVIPDLPKKTEILQTVSLTREQHSLYEDIRKGAYRRVREAAQEKGIARCGVEILSALLKLRQVCCDPRLLSPAEGQQDAGSAKLEWLLDLLPEMIQEGRRILLFSQFTTMLSLLERTVRELGIEYVTLTGKTKDRALPVERFQSGQVPLFLVSLKAGGVGLNLTAADTVVHYDPWWNPAAERQATDRAHRIGQSNPVFVYKLISVGTVEERIQALQARKQALADGLYDGSGGANPQWTEEDVDELFKPIS